MAEIPNNCLDPETLRMVGAVYDLAVANLQKAERPEAVREIIAARIMASAMSGECDFLKLCQVALRGITLQN